MPADIFKFWAQIPRDARVHPADREVFGRVRDHGFDLRALPGCYMGPLRTAPVVLLFLSPGSSAEDRASPRLVEWHRRTRGGGEPLVSESVHRSAYRWWTERTKCLECRPEELAKKVAVLNIGAYHSESFADYSMLAALPSSRVALDWAQGSLFPAAEAGHRVVICLRAARYWGLEVGRKYRGSLFAPSVTRGGHMLTENRGKIVAAVRRAIHGS